jgi:predicted Zn-dependent protease
MEQEMGQALKKNLVEESTIDRAKTIKINKFYSQLKTGSDYQFNITVVNSDVTNAFALPGGEIVVYSSLLNKIQTPHELAALLGHESGHIEKRHTLRLILKSLSNYLIISAIFGDVSGIMAVIIENASMIETLSYNRSVEEESDNYGFDIMIKNNLDPNGMISLFEHLKTEDPSTGKQPEFLMTHPKLENRIEEVQKRIRNTKYTVSPNDSLVFYFNQLKQ